MSEFGRMVTLGEERCVGVPAYSTPTELKLSPRYDGPSAIGPRTFELGDPHRESSGSSGAGATRAGDFEKPFVRLFGEVKGRHMSEALSERLPRRGASTSVAATGYGSGTGGERVGRGAVRTERTSLSTL